MARKNSIPMRTDPQFKKIVQEIQLENMRKGKLFSERRITLAMSRIPNLKKFVLEKGIKNEK